MVCVILGAFAIAFWFAPGTVQARHMRAVDRFLPSLRPAVEGDPRFKVVELHTYTGSDGSLLVRGEVDSDADLAALREIVDQFRCPRPIEWRVEVIDPAWRAARDAADAPTAPR